VRLYLLLIRWESIEAHMAWRETDDFERWRELTHPFYVERPWSPTSTNHSLANSACRPEFGAQHVGDFTEVAILDNAVFIG